MLHLLCISSLETCCVYMNNYRGMHNFKLMIRKANTSLISSTSTREEDGCAGDRNQHMKKRFDFCFALDMRWVNDAWSGSESSGLNKERFSRLGQCVCWCVCGCACMNEWQRPDNSRLAVNVWFVSPCEHILLLLDEYTGASVYINTRRHTLKQQKFTQTKFYCVSFKFVCVNYPTILILSNAFATETLRSSGSGKTLQFFVNCKKRQRKISQALTVFHYCATYNNCMTTY